MLSCYFISILFTFCPTYIVKPVIHPVRPVYYFTHYDLGDVGQTDSSPCTGASGKNLCELAQKGINTMALTSDIRKQLGIKWGDRVLLEGER